MDNCLAPCAVCRKVTSHRHCNYLLDKWKMKLQLCVRLPRRQPKVLALSRTSALCLAGKLALFALGNNGFENVHLLKCALSRYPVKDDELPSVYSGFCSSQSKREVSSPESSQGASGKLKFRLSLSRVQADSRYRA